MTDMDSSGLDYASSGALLTDLDVGGLEGATDGMSLPDPVDDADGTDVADATDGDRPSGRRRRRAGRRSRRDGIGHRRSSDRGLRRNGVRQLRGLPPRARSRPRLSDRDEERSPCTNRWKPWRTNWRPPAGGSPEPPATRCRAPIRSGMARLGATAAGERLGEW